MEAIDFLLEPLRSGIGRRALLEIALVGAFCGALGFWIVTERLAYAAESLSHGMLPGLVLAALAGTSLLLGAAAGALGAAVLVALATRDERIGPDTGTAVAVTGLVGLGALLALAPDAPQRLEELLFGDLLGVSDTDLAAAALLLLGRDPCPGGPAPPACRHGLRLAGSRGGRGCGRGWCERACWACSPPPSRWPCRASAPCSCWPSWWPRRWRSAGTRPPRRGRCWRVRDWRRSRVSSVSSCPTTRARRRARRWLCALCGGRPGGAAA